jgi:two-component system, NarL family, sensor kinase
MGEKSLYEILDERSLAYHIENTQMGIIVYGKDQQVIYWSKRAAEIFEWQAEETLCQSLATLNIVHEEDVHKVAAVIGEIMSGNKDFMQITNRNYTRSGKMIYCNWYNSALKDASGQIQSLISFVLDVTDHETAVQQLKESENQLSLIYNSAIDPMWLIDIEGPDQFRFATINDAFTPVTGLSREQVVGFLIEEVMPVSSHQLVRAKYNEAISSGKVIDYVEIAEHPAGEKVGEIRVIPVKDKQGAVTKLVGIANDVTEKAALQKKLDQERETLSKKITAAAIKGQEIERHNISRELHDNVNQVLTTVKLYTELCSAGSVDTAVILPKCTLLLNETINEIRRLSKQLSGPSMDHASLGDVLKDLVQSVQETQAIDIELSTASSCQAVDPELRLAIYRIAQEHLTNILKHAGARHVNIQLKTKKGQLYLTISDDGAGFDTRQKTNGIGITNMTSRAQLLNGSLKIKSAVGKGCTLQAVFPVECSTGICQPVSLQNNRMNIL